MPATAYYSAGRQGGREGESEGEREGGAHGCPALGISVQTVLDAVLSMLAHFPSLSVCKTSPHWSTSSSPLLMKACLG